MSMTDMDHSSDSSTMMSMSQMSMTFFTSTSTPLYSSAWTPSTTGAYAGTCIFLVVLAALFRGLLALKYAKEAAWLHADTQRRYVAVAGKQGLAERLTRDEDAKSLVISENGVEERVVVVQKRGVETRPWRLSVDPVRAGMDVIIAGVGYLLMLAVMTMNVGYFLSVLAGVFVGSLAVGRYAPLEH